MARVQNAAGPGLDRGLDPGPVQRHLVGARIARRDEKYLLGALERVEQRRRVVVGTAPDADAAAGEALAVGVLADTAWESVCAAILTGPDTAAVTGPAAAAVTLRAALPGLTTLTAAERALLGDWLDRIAESPATPRTASVGTDW